MNTDILQLVEISGTNYECGVTYGEIFASRLVGFFSMNIRYNERLLLYARKCWRIIKKRAPKSAMFIKGIAAGSKINIERIVLLILHEEILHEPHCTAFVCKNKEKKVIVAQNWDWPPEFYPWPCLLKLAIENQPVTLTYNYPGFWTANGINKHGLALMWTGSGFFPKVKPVVGIPTYVIINELLQCRTVDEALVKLRSLKNAGSFIFFLGDALGKYCVVEAIPKKYAVETGERFVCRANYFINNEIIKLSRQKAGVLTENEQTSCYEYLKRTLENQKYYSHRTIRETLTDQPIIHNISFDDMTIDSMYAVCADRAFYTARGGHNPSHWQCIYI